MTSLPLYVLMGCLQVKEKKETLARLETLDNGKPIGEAAWDIVRTLLPQD